ncbi:MAG: segregation/condensation protein A [Actinobacteria bacterium]|nr:MAG: segregation/condensation protein A [Actinomycetota bacterium]
MPYEVHTPVFEGDLELLTQLVTRQELDVFGLCLASLVEAFLAEARVAMESGAEAFDLDTSTEFLLRAATLVELKTRYLLIEDDDEVPDELPTPEDRDLLLARLLQGRTFKEAAGVLAALIRAADRCAPRRMGPEEPLASVDIDPLESVTADELRSALFRALAPRPVVDLYHVTPIRASVSDAIDRVLGALTRCEQLSLFDLNTEEPADRLEYIVRFLAVLELFKRGLVEITPLGAFGDLVVRAAPPEEPGAEGLAMAWEEPAVP